MTTPDLKTYCQLLARRSRQAGRTLATASGAVRNHALQAIAQRLSAQSAIILAANAQDLETARLAGLPAAMLDRLRLDPKRLAAMAQALHEIAAQTDPVGQVLDGSVRPNGLRIQKVRVPLGVILFIYESRPNVTSDAAGLCLKSGNAVILRGGKEAALSNAAIVTAIRQALADAGLPPDAVILVDNPDHAAVTELVRLEGQIDLVIPRGGEALIRTVVAQARIPVIKHFTGNCHVYVDAAADQAMAVDICLNAKVQKPSVCNAAESLLFHRTAADRGVLAAVCQALADKGVEVRGCDRTRALFPQAKPATEEDWSKEYLDLIVSVKVVDSVDQAIDHINHYGSAHTDAIVTDDLRAADLFVQRVDSAGVFVNCSTRFADGGEYGLGAEVGISTDKLHARGPMGAADLTTYKWVVHGSGQTRT
jgi:glutamate-5-semialdehyde dehydrogenase